MHSSLQPALRPRPVSSGGELAVAGVGLATDTAGALYWPEQRLLAVADLHLEKGSSFAGRGVLLPPYDTAATLGRVSPLAGPVMLEIGRASVVGEASEAGMAEAAEDLIKEARA